MTMDRWSDKSKMASDGSACKFISSKIFWEKGEQVIITGRGRLDSILWLFRLFPFE